MSEQEAWDSLTAKFKSKLVPTKQWTPEEYEAMAHRLVAYALANPDKWTVDGTTLGGQASLVLQKADWEPSFSYEDWTEVSRILRNKNLVPESIGFSFGSFVETPLSFWWCPPDPRFSAAFRRPD